VGALPVPPVDGDDEDEVGPLFLDPPEVVIPIPRSEASTRRLAGLIGYPDGPCPVVCPCPSVTVDAALADLDADNIVRGLSGDDGLPCFTVVPPDDAAVVNSGRGARNSERGSSVSGCREEGGGRLPPDDRVDESIGGGWRWDQDVGLWQEEREAGARWAVTRTTLLRCGTRAGRW
jgi:hypothetical protein